MRTGPCIALALSLAAPVAAQQPAAPPARVLERPDGSAIHHYLEPPAGAARRPALIMLQGSGCNSVGRNGRIAWMAPRLAPRHILVRIEKYGVAPGADGENCSAEFWRGNTLHQRVLDVVQLVAALRRERWWNGELVLFGGSEGGAVAAMAAPLIPEVRAVIVWSSGIGQPVGEMIRSVLPPPMQQEAPRIFEEARDNPTGGRQWGGASYRWWADAVDLVPARSLVQARAPILLVHGGRDRSEPVASARATDELMRAAGRPHFTYREYPDYDHFMVDSAGVDHRAEVVAEIAEWLRRSTR